MSSTASSGSASPSQGHAQSPATSNHGTPTSSTTQLVDPRNKPLPSNDNLGASSLHGSLQPGQPSLSSSLTSNNSFQSLSSSQPSSLGSSGGAAGSGAMNHNNASTPSRGAHHLPPSVVVSPSGPVSLHNVSRTLLDNANIYVLCSMFRRLVLLRRCPPTSPRQNPVRSAYCSIDSKQRQRMCQKELEHRNASTLQDSISQINGKENWRSFLASTKCHQTDAKSCSCRRPISATSFSTSMMPVGT